MKNKALVLCTTFLICAGISLPTLVFAQDSHLTRFRSFIEQIVSVFNLNVDRQTAQVVSSLDQGLVGHWRLDEGSAHLAYDSSGNMNTGLLGNFPVDNSGWVAGKVGSKALNFKALSGNRVTVSTSTMKNLDFGTGSFTISFWMWPEGVQTNGAMPVTKGREGYAFPGFRFYLTALNKLYFDIMSNGTSVGAGTDISGYVTGWANYVGVWDAPNKTASLYINGVQASSGTNSGILSVNNSHEFRLGASGAGGYYFNGKMDDVRAYNRALAPSEVSQLYAQTSGGGTTYTVESLGSPLQMNTQEHQIMYKTADGHRHLQMYYNTFGAYPMDVVDIDVETGKTYSSVFQNVKGRPGPNCHVYYPGTNKTYVSSGDPGHFAEFDPVTGVTRYVHSLRYKGGQYCDIGDDGWIYIGGITSAVAKGSGLERYNPMTDTYEDLGILDPTFNGSLQYSYTLGADTRYVYVGLGQLPWYLAIYDTQAPDGTNPVTLHWSSEGDTAGTVSKGLDGKWYYRRGNPTLGNKYYKLENGVPVLLTTSLPPQNHWSLKGNTYNDKTIFGTVFNTIIDLDQSTPNSGNDNTAIIKWQKDGGIWESSTIKTLSLAPADIVRLYSNPADPNKIIGWAGEYGPVFTYDTSLSLLKTLGYPTRSLYHGLVDGNTLYMSGYPASTLRYDMTKPWTLSASTVNINSSTNNPYLLTIGGIDAGGQCNGKYHYYNAKGSDGKIYVGVHHERDTVGGGLCWYDPVTGTSGGLREPFLNYDVRDLIAVSNGTKIVYSSLQGPDPEGKLFVLDVATKKIERIIAPVPGAGHLDKIAEGEPGTVIGLVINSTPHRYYKVNVLTGEVLWVKALGGIAYSGMNSAHRRLVKGPDGYVWLFIDNFLSRINPVDGSIERILTAPVSSLMFNGNDIYLFGGTSLSRIKNAIPGNPTPTPPPPTLNTHPADTTKDSKIDINEVTTYGSCFKTACNFQNPPSPIPIDYATNAGFIWKLGELYRYDGTTPCTSISPGCFKSGP